MSDWWNSIKKIFQASEESTSSKPVLHTLIQRSPGFLLDLERWEQGVLCQRMLTWIEEQYTIYNSKTAKLDNTISFLDTPSSKGFAIHFYKTNYTSQEAEFLLDILKKRVQKENYHIQISDSRTYNRANWVERVDRHYLKPRIQFEDKSKINQLYGNILIELEYRNDQVYHLKFRATAYTDHLYQKGKAFQKLMTQIIKV